MEIKLKKIGEINVVELIGDVDASSAGKVQEQLIPLAQPESNILLDLTQVPYMSSAGLRMLLSLYRHVSAKEGKLILVGVGEEIQDTMSVTGFIDFFEIFDTQKAGLAAFS